MSDKDLRYVAYPRMFNGQHWSVLDHRQGVYVKLAGETVEFTGLRAEAEALATRLNVEEVRSDG